MKLGDMKVKEFIEELAGNAPAPGGGSAAALAGAIGAALCAMVARLTVGKKKYESAWPDMTRARDRADRVARRLLSLTDEDTEAYNAVLAAMRLPRESETQKSERRQAIESAALQAAEVPLNTLKEVVQAVELVRLAVERGNPNCLTDAGVAGHLLRAAAFGAAYNVRINLSAISDQALCDRLRKEVSFLLAQAMRDLDQISREVEARLQ